MIQPINNKLKQATQDEYARDPMSYVIDVHNHVLVDKVNEIVSLLNDWEEKMQARARQIEMGESYTKAMMRNKATSPLQGVDEETLKELATIANNNVAKSEDLPVEAASPEEVEEKIAVEESKSNGDTKTEEVSESVSEEQPSGEAQVN